MKIICIGRNYAAHAREMHAGLPTTPVVFLKPDTALLRGNEPFYHPEFSSDIHHEVEVVYRVAKPGKYIAKEHAWKYLDGIGLGIDFTARDLQSEAKAKGLPWELGKAFNGSAPVSEFLPLATFPDHRDIRFSLLVNGQERQRGHTADLIFPAEDVVAYVSQFFTLRTGDLLFTGTPEGVAAVNPADRLQGFLAGRLMFDFEVK